MFNVMPAEEMTFDGGLIPEGTLVMVEVAESRGPQKSTNPKNPDNYMLNWMLQVCEGAYTGSRLYDNVGTAGSDNFMLMGKMKMSYVLETSRNAHVNKDYNINSYDDFLHKKVVVKVGVETYKKKDGTFGYKNVTKAYGSPRQDSKNHKYYSEYKLGLQPYQTDVLPKLPVIPTNGGYYQGDYADQDIPL